MKNIIKRHFAESSQLIRTMSNHEKEIIKIVNLISQCNTNNKKILIAGNGGSSADAEHFTGELTCTFKSKKRAALSVICLSSQSSAITAWSNDFKYETFFARQVEAHGKVGDILILISTSGGIKSSSMNLVNAANLAKRKGLKIISLVGKTGGRLKTISNISINVKSFVTAHIQEAHMSILHCICECLEKKIKN